MKTHFITILKTRIINYSSRIRSDEIRQRIYKEKIKEMDDLFLRGLVPRGCDILFRFIFTLLIRFDRRFTTRRVSFCFFYFHIYIFILSFKFL